MKPKHGAELDCLLFPPSPPLARQRLTEEAVRLRGTFGDATSGA